MDVITRTKSYAKWRWKITRITFLSLFYNEHLSGDYVFDTLMQPAFWFVDHFTKTLGPLFVLLVIFLTVIELYDETLVDDINTLISVLCGNHSLLDWSTLLSTIQEWLPADRLVL